MPLGPEYTCQSTSLLGGATGGRGARTLSSDSLLLTVALQAAAPQQHRWELDPDPGASPRPAQPLSEGPGLGGPGAGDGFLQELWAASLSHPLVACGIGRPWEGRTEVGRAGDVGGGAGSRDRQGVGW